MACVAIIRDITARNGPRRRWKESRPSWKQNTAGRGSREVPAQEPAGRPPLGSLVTWKPAPSWVATARASCHRRGRGWIERGWLGRLRRSGHGKGAGNVQEVFLGGSVALPGTGLDMKGALVAANRLVKNVGTGRFLVGSSLRVMRGDEASCGKRVRWVGGIQRGAQHNVWSWNPDAVVAAGWPVGQEGRHRGFAAIGLFDTASNLTPVTGESGSAPNPGIQMAVFLKRRTQPRPFWY